MKKIQLFVIWGVVLGLTGYGIYTKLSETFDYAYEHDPRYQVYSVEEPPKRVFFAGEPVPLEEKAVAKKFQRELYVQTQWNYSRVQLLKRAQYWLPKITPIIKQYQIPEDFKYLAVIESMLMNVESPKSAAGFWQIMAGTGTDYGLEINEEVDERYNPIKATHAACKYLKRAHRRFGNWTSVAAAYNAGMAAISGAYRRQQVSSFYGLQLNRETAGYVFRAVAVKQLIEHPREYGYKRRYSNNPYDVPLKRITVKESIPNLTAFAAKYGVSPESLKRHNAWLLKNTLTIKEPGKTYTLLLPRTPDLLATTPDQKATNTAPDSVRVRPTVVDSLSARRK